MSVFPLLLPGLFANVMWITSSPIGSCALLHTTGERPQNILHKQEKPSPCQKIRSCVRNQEQLATLNNKYLKGWSSYGLASWLWEPLWSLWCLLRVTITPVPQQPNLFLSLLYPAAALSCSCWEYMFGYSAFPSKWMKFEAKKKRKRHTSVRKQMIS